MKKKTPKVWSRAPGKQTSKPTENQMSQISAAFEPLMENLRKDLKPVPQPQRWNHCVDVFTRWRSNHFYVMQKYQCPPDATITDFETGVARLEYLGPDSFNLAYFRHNDKWFTLQEGISLKACLEAIEQDPWFHV